MAGGAVFRLRRKVMGATVDKILTLRDDHPFLYQEHVFSGGSGAISVAHHPMTAMQRWRQAGLFAEAVCRDARTSRWSPIRPAAASCSPIPRAPPT